jgi:lipoyl(octanoyl) transferase
LSSRAGTIVSRDSRHTAVALEVRDLGSIGYAEAFRLQKALQREVIDRREAPGDPLMHLLLLEHVPPVITVTRRPGARGPLLADSRQLEAAGVEVADTDRGGDITYHGPGQLVAYPILDLNALGLRLHGYMRFLEQVVIDTLGSFGLAGHRDPAAPGVWVGGAGDGPAGRKICAMGVRLSRWVSMHGLALNVTTSLEHFDLIVPCGLAGRQVTSMERELGSQCPEIGEVKEEMIRRFREGVQERHAAAPPGRTPRSCQE